MSTKSREVIWGGQILGAKMRARGAREVAKKAAREADRKCRSCRTPRYSPRVHMVKLTEHCEIAPYKWVHADDDR
jgi:hypothetical protein